ncbi:hypothetical protein NMY22_g4867 [Coprinellus aureogranulatus]|nr:hypothetical protein NMY22_g4867 [Coprinellus aureogranulatus]
MSDGSFEVPETLKLGSRYPGRASRLSEATAGAAALAKQRETMAFLVRISPLKTKVSAQRERLNDTVGPVSGQLVLTERATR